MASTSQITKNLHTVLGQMADLERGKRIKGLREGTIDRQTPIPSPRYLKQRQVIEGVEEMTGGAFFVTIRGYQDWERTGGIKFENAVLLAQLYSVDPDWLFFGPNRGVASETPDLSAMLNGSRRDDVEVLERLAQIEAKLDRLLTALATRPAATGEPRDVPAKLPPDPDRQQEPPAEEPGETGA